MGITRVALPDIEVVAALVHLDWLQNQRTKGIDSHVLEDGEQAMVPYHQLSEDAKDNARSVVKVVYAAIQAAS